jgi:glutamate synthase domain-containing protein 3
MNEMIGQTDKIIPVKLYDHWKVRGVDLSKPLFKAEPLYETNLYRSRNQITNLDKQIDNDFIKQSRPALEYQIPVQITSSIKNVNRSVGTMLSGEIARKYGDEGLPDGTIKIELNGTAGQSFGTFLAKGIELCLTGESNDYTGKGLSGGKIIIKVSPKATFDPAENIIAGNTCLYGATSGEAYINGIVGERFAVRNSGAKAVVEGTGDHCCEYMTGGRVVILGRIGRNFGAGMSGGIAYIWDPSKDGIKYINPGMVDIEYLIYDEDIEEVKSLITKHLKYTGSKRADFIIENWTKQKDNFWKIIPGEYKKALVNQTKLADESKKGLEKIVYG